MRYRIAIFAVLALCLTTVSGVNSVPDKAEAKVNVSAESAIVMDVQSGIILYEKNIDKREYPASITKIMTALIAIRYGRPD